MLGLKKTLNYWYKGRVVSVRLCQAPDRKYWFVKYFLDVAYVVEHIDGEYLVGMCNTDRAGSKIRKIPSWDKAVLAAVIRGVQE